MLIPSLSFFGEETLIYVAIFYRQRPYYAEDKTVLAVNHVDLIWKQNKLCKLSESISQENPYSREK
ncbi:MAG TPA: hypothetical protein DDZ91_00665 [Firmicutes bacterium]|nr:hypothetical protein [Bacillota bacterium]